MPEPQELPAPETAASTPPRRPRLIALGLVVFGLLTWGTEGPLGSPLLFVVAVTLTALLFGDTFSFGWFRKLQERTPGVPWSNLHAIAVWGLVVVGLLRSGLFFGFIVFTIGVAMLARQRSTQLGPLEVRTAWATWGRRAMLIPFVLAALTLSAQWDGDFRSSYESGGYRYTTEMAGSNAYETGDARVLTVLLVLTFAALALRRADGPAWQRFAPLATGAVAGLVAFGSARADNAEINELYAIGGTYAKFAAPGAPWFTLFMVVFCVAAVVFAVRPLSPGRRPAPSGS